MLPPAPPTDPRVLPCRAPSLHHSWALGVTLASSAAIPQVHLAYLLPLHQGQVGRPQDAYTTEDPSQYWVSEILPDWVIQLLGLLAPDLCKLLVEQGCFLLWVPGGQESAYGGGHGAGGPGKTKGSWALGLLGTLFLSSGPSGSGTGRLCLRGAVEQKLGPYERQRDDRENRQ